MAAQDVEDNTGCDDDDDDDGNDDDNEEGAVVRAAVGLRLDLPTLEDEDDDDDDDDDGNDDEEDDDEVGGDACRTATTLSPKETFLVPSSLSTAFFAIVPFSVFESKTALLVRVGDFSPSFFASCAEPRGSIAVDEDSVDRSQKISLHRLS